MNTNNIDHQPHWDELLSQTELRRIREENKWNHIQQQQPKKKRRCCGNRKLQRFRKACRAKGLTEQRIKMLIEMRQPLDYNIDNKKRQDDASTWNSNHTINISIDKNQNQFNKCQTTRMIPSSTSIQPMKVHHLSKEDWRQSSKLIPNYNRLSPHTFKQLILKNIPTIYHDQIQQCLACIQLLKYVQRLANLWCHFFQLKIEEDYWNYLDNLHLLVMNDLNPFHVHFEQKKLLLHFNFHDAYLVKSFYDLDPTEKQIHLVQQIWQTKLNSCERLLREKTKIILPDNNPIVNMNLLSIDDFVPVMLAIIEARLVTIEQRTQVIMEFINTPSQ
ncbi:unnamed protein product [Rotaria magnacalcarata]|uniref:Uncharacterized protein n=1 Tax=Rotaria magnacalcarata TaxID=392030 RepID=A0A816FWK6_9BILA|nr:unnamed protein product [Rotaria magnacalcarata]CAF4483467.1 unnamed protein product [Rotaria magnacalcarata]